MKVVGLTGSMAAGKSTVAALLRGASIPVFDADEAVHELYASRDVANVIEQVFPGTGADGKVNRTRLAEAVLGRAEQLQRLESIVHPLVQERRNEFLRKHAAAGAATVVIDVPLLFETGQQAGMDLTILVCADPTVRKQRAMQRPGMTEEKWQAIFARQMPEAAKRELADIVVENNGSLQDLREKVDALVMKLQ